jgi:non-ribosomal peptide synthetase component E (peptide arylation enzyme)
MRYAKDNKDRACFTKEGWYKSGDLGFLDKKANRPLQEDFTDLFHEAGKRYLLLK